MLARVAIALGAAVLLAPDAASAHACCRIEILTLEIDSVTVGGVALEDLSAYQLERAPYLESYPVNATEEDVALTIRRGSNIVFDEVYEGRGPDGG